MTRPASGREWIPAEPHEDAWVCELLHRSPVPVDLERVPKLISCPFPVGARTSCGATASLQKVRVATTAY